MRQIKEIKDAIEKLSEFEYKKLRKWFIEMDWKKWDKQITDDSMKGELDFLIEEANEEKRRGKLKLL